MKRRTQKKPLIFSEGNVEFKSEAFGFLQANELLLEYLPLISDIFEKVKTEEGQEEVDIMPLLKEIPKDIITKLSKDLFEKTYCKYEDEKEFSLLDPDDFESLSEMFAVAKHIFSYNWPDFFEQGEGSELQSQPLETQTEETHIPTSEVIQL